LPKQTVGAMARASRRAQGLRATGSGEHIMFLGNPGHAFELQRTGLG